MGRTCNEISTHSFAIRRLTATSFSTPRSSKVCGVNASFRRILLQIGQGAGPSVNSLSMHDSHLNILASFNWIGGAVYIHTFCGSMSLPAGEA